MSARCSSGVGGVIASPVRHLLQFLPGLLPPHRQEVLRGVHAFAPCAAPLPRRRDGRCAGARRRLCARPCRLCRQQGRWPRPRLRCGRRRSAMLGGAPACMVRSFGGDSSHWPRGIRLGRQGVACPPVPPSDTLLNAGTRGVVGGCHHPHRQGPRRNQEQSPPSDTVGATLWPRPIRCLWGTRRRGRDSPQARWQVGNSHAQISSSACCASARGRNSCACRAQFSSRACHARIRRHPRGSRILKLLPRSLCRVLSLVCIVPSRAAGFPTRRGQRRIRALQQPAGRRLVAPRCRELPIGCTQWAWPGHCGQRMNLRCRPDAAASGARKAAHAAQARVGADHFDSIRLRTLRAAVDVAKAALIPE
eukprot:scaffold13606_cov118-Isochrysis_galbana.AAC.3